MNRDEKAAQVSALKGRLEGVTSIILADFRGINVETVTGIRNEFRAAGCEYRVLKNSLVKLAIKGTAMEPMARYLEGPTALALSFDHPAAAAKVATKQARESEKFVIKGGYFDGTVLDKTGVEALATMPGKDELRAMLLATFQAVPQQFLRTLIAAPQNLVYALAARERQLGG